MKSNKANSAGNEPIIHNRGPVPDKYHDLDKEENKEYRDMFSNLQGNILKGHGRDFSVNIFLSFSKKDEDLWPVLKDLGELVTSAYIQIKETEQFNRFKIPGSMFGNLFLTANGYRKLGYSESHLQEWFKDEEDLSDIPETVRSAFPQNSNFISGMKAAASDFGDLPKDDLTIEQLEEEQRAELSPLQKYSIDNSKLNKSLLEPLEKAYLELDNYKIDAMLLLADDDEDHLLRKTRSLISQLEKEEKAHVLAVELGKALRNDDGEGIEHFGYVDGRSQPLFLKSDFSYPNGRDRIERINEKAIRKESGDIDIWDPLASLDLVLLPDKATNIPNSYGSYFVFRKLEQDVLRFSMAEQQLADKLKLEGSDRERAGAMVVGRFRDGTPLALSETDGFIPAKSNNFRFDGLDAHLKNFDSVRDDTFGLKCPFPAHIRKTNPRQAFNPDDKIEEIKNDPEKIKENEKEDLARRIVRRGITYGERNRAPNTFQALDDLPTGGVGLLFACFQSSIVRQFAFMQKTWVNNVNFKVGNASIPATGLDPLIGQSLDINNSNARPKQRWRKEYGGSLQPNPESLNKLDLSQSHSTEFEISNFIKFRGGEFFFAPSIPFIRGDAKPVDRNAR